MTPKDAAKIVAMITRNYPSNYDTDEKVNDTVSLWVQLFGHHKASDVWAAVSAHMVDPDKGRFPPNAANIAGRLPVVYALAPDSPEHRAVGWAMARNKEITAKYAALGVPSPREAREHHIPFLVWAKMVDKAEGREEPWR